MIYIILYHNKKDLKKSDPVESKEYICAERLALILDGHFLSLHTSGGADACTSEFSLCIQPNASQLVGRTGKEYHSACRTAGVTIWDGNTTLSSMWTFDELTCGSPIFVLPNKSCFLICSEDKTSSLDVPSEIILLFLSRSVPHTCLRQPAEREKRDITSASSYPTFFPFHSLIL